MDLIFFGQLLASVLFLGIVYALTAIGLNLVYGTLRLLNIAHGDLIMLGAHVGFWGFSLFAISPFQSMFAAVLLGAGLALVVYALLLRPIATPMPGRRNSMSHIPSNSAKNRIASIVPRACPRCRSSRPSSRRLDWIGKSSARKWSAANSTRSWARPGSTVP